MPSVGVWGALVINIGFSGGCPGTNYAKPKFHVT